MICSWGTTLLQICSIIPNVTTVNMKKKSDAISNLRMRSHKHKGLPLLNSEHLDISTVTMLL